MLKAITRTVNLARTPLSRSVPAFSTGITQDPTCIQEAPRIDNENALLPPEELQQRKALEATVPVPSKVDITPINGVPEEHIVSRRVRIYQPSKNAMQSGTNNIHHWEMEFDNRQRWENPLMGWTSSGDPLSNMKVQFSNPEEAIDHCEKNGWAWFLDIPKTEKEIRPKSYGLNFSWNRRTRVSTK